MNKIAQFVIVWIFKMNLFNSYFKCFTYFVDNFIMYENILYYFLMIVEKKLFVSTLLRRNEYFLPITWNSQEENNCQNCVIVCEYD